MSEELSLKEMQKAWHGSLKSYIKGFFACFVLTSLSFFVVWASVFSTLTTILIISGLALIQAAFQLKYFFHLGEEGSPYWETLIFLFMFLILLIIACGSLWVMHDLHQRTMTQIRESPSSHE
ncbi:MAG: cytochrome C oxidase subunit IV family protein [Waddliaceae bacterium]